MSVNGDGDRPPWDRQAGETMRAYAAFRVFRDLGPARALEPVWERGDVGKTSVRRWSIQHAWSERAEAWDSEQYRVEDAARLEAIRLMHANHQRAGRAAMHKALLALEALPVNHIPAGAAARLLELGARLERQTLTVSVEDLQGLAAEEEEAGEDPWERIARELEGTDETA